MLQSPSTPAHRGRWWILRPSPSALIFRSSCYTRSPGLIGEPLASDPRCRWRIPRMTTFSSNLKPPATRGFCAISCPRPSGLISLLPGVDRGFTAYPPALISLLAGINGESPYSNPHALLALRGDGGSPAHRLVKSSYCTFPLLPGIEVGSPATHTPLILFSPCV